MRIHVISIILFLFIISSCERKTKPYNYKSIPKQRIEYRDSLFILYTLNNFYKNDWESFRDDSKFYRIDTTKIQYLIERIFYSPDKKKMLVWVITKTPNGPSSEKYSSNPKNNYLCPNSAKIVYDLHALVGFRESKNEKWKIYPYDNLIVVCSNSISEAVELFKKYYFEQMKDHSEYLNKKFLDKNYGGAIRYDLEDETIKDGYGDKNASVILKNYGYNLQDKDFWTKSLIWQKGARIPGLYNFQTTGNVTPDEKNVELYPPKIVYPNSILKLYK